MAVGNIGKLFNAVGSIGNVVTESVTGVSSIVCLGKDTLVGTITQYQKENELDRAKERIIARANAIKELTDSLNITKEEAEKLLDAELAKGA